MTRDTTRRSQCLRPPPSARCAVSAQVALLMGAVLAGAADAQERDGGAWTTESTDRIIIKTRTPVGSRVKEVLAEGDLDVPAQDLQTAVTTTPRYPHFMPYVTEARELGTPLPDGTRFVYTRVTLPVVSDRDFVTRDRLVRPLEADGGGEFIDVWEVAPGLLPPVKNVVRLSVNSGAWHVTPSDGGCGSHVVYQFTIDPGGSVPAFMADKANRDGVSGVFRALEGEARRVHAARVLR